MLEIFLKQCVDHYYHLLPYRGWGCEVSSYIISALPGIDS